MAIKRDRKGEGAVVQVVVCLALCDMTYSYM